MPLVLLMRQVMLSSEAAHLCAGTRAGPGRGVHNIFMLCGWQSWPLRLLGNDGVYYYQGGSDPYLPVVMWVQITRLGEAVGPYGLHSSTRSSQQMVAMTALSVRLVGDFMVIMMVMMTEC